MATFFIYVSVGKNVEILEPSCTINVKCYRHCEENTSWAVPQKVEQRILHNPTILLLENPMELKIKTQIPILQYL